MGRHKEDIWHSKVQVGGQRDLQAHEAFSAMRPVESLKILISHMMIEQMDDEGEPLCLGVWD
eukprot:12937728-Prorocentrum_lima.AAC.1